MAEAARGRREAMTRASIKFPPILMARIERIIEMRGWPDFSTFIRQAAVDLADREDEQILAESVGWDWREKVQMKRLEQMSERQQREQAHRHTRQEAQKIRQDAGDG